MIPARKSRWFAAWFGRHCERRLRATFSEVHVHGLERLRVPGALLVVSNHTAWWDPLVAIVLTQRLAGLDSYAMMNATNLRRLPFFAKMGAFGVDLDDPNDGARALRYAARLLRSGRTVWIFAQGDERPITEPLAFRPGSAHLARLAPDATVVPLALRYEHGNLERPRLFVSIGAPSADQQGAVQAELARIDAHVREPGDAFTCIMQQSRSWLGAFAERFLSVLTQPPRTERERPSPPV